MPKCPYCEEPVSLNSTGNDVRKEVRKEARGAIDREVMYYCPHCESVLGFAFFKRGWFTLKPQHTRETKWAIGNELMGNRQTHSRL